MTSLSSSPLLVALLQAATSLPVFLVGFPAGAIANIVDRRRMLLITQGWMLLAAAGLSLSTALDLTNAWLLLVFTFVLGLGAAVNTPVWQSIVSELVPRPQLPAAIALNGVGINLARAIGPALAGLIVAATGPEAVFLLNAATYIGVMAVLYRWHRQPRQSTLPSERFLGAMRAGIRYVRHAPAFQAVLIRAGVFISCGSALWALLPTLARQELRLGAIGYGVLLGCIGVGAVAGAFLLPKIRQRFSSDKLVIWATILFALVTLTAAKERNLGLLSGAMVVGGVAWIALLSCLNVAAQTTVPTWVQARALGVYQLVFQGGMAIGSIIWGVIASRTSTPVSLTVAALGLMVGLIAAARYRLKAGENQDLTPSLHWAEPSVVIEPKAEDGPVLVTLEYHIDSKDSLEFVQAMYRLCQVRQRDGAIRWSLWNDLGEPGRYIETFIVESWTEHKRQHERVTVTDLEVEQRARSFLIKEEPPTASHLIYTHPTEAG